MSFINFKNKIVVISGGGTGIGLEIARSFLKSKAKVIILGRRKDILQKGIEQLRNNNIEESENLFRQAINDSPNYGLPYKYLGDINHLNRDLVKAVENWEKFIELSPKDNYKVFDNIETALFDLGRYSEVEKFYRKVLDGNPNDINAGQRLANVLNEKGENKAAIALIDQFIEQNEASISVMLMKLKLSLLTKTPAELGYYLDEILDKIKNENS